MVTGTGVKPSGMAMWAQIATRAVASTTAITVFQAMRGTCNARRLSCLKPISSIFDLSSMAGAPTAATSGARLRGVMPQNMPGN